MESLRDDQKADLNWLKKWLYQHCTRARLDRDKAEKRQKAEEAKAELEVIQPSMFDF